MQSDILNDEQNVTLLKKILETNPENKNHNSSIFDNSRLITLQANLKDLKTNHSNILDQMNAYVTETKTSDNKQLDEIAELLTHFKNHSFGILSLIEKKKRTADNLKAIIISRVQTSSPTNNPFEEHLKTSSLMYPDISNQTPINTVQGENEEKDCRKYLVDKDYQQSISDIRKSFIRPKRGIDDDNQTLHSILIDRDSYLASNSQLARSSYLTPTHPWITELLRNNNAYLQYPVTETAPNRSQLPALRDPAKKVNVWSILKENIGKDLSKMSMPVYAKEPITLLQKMAEFLEYRYLIKQANQTDDSQLRIAYITCFFILWISQNKQRLAASFNSLLGETYEFIDKDLKIVFELVNNHPPICACYGESNDFIIDSSFHIKTNLSFSGMDFQTLGDFLITLKKTGELFTVKRPKITLHNFIFGDLFIWLKNDLVVTNQKTKEKAIVKFRPKGWSTKHDYELTGEIFDHEGTPKYSIAGKWDSFMNITNLNNNQTIEIGRKFPDPENCKYQYGFTFFAINANYKTIDQIAKFPPTESRLRPDVHAYENGDFEIASFEKNRLEENQRKRRKQNLFQKPYWFKLEMENNSFKTTYNGGYFEAKQSGRWPRQLVNLFND